MNTLNCKHVIINSRDTNYQINMINVAADAYTYKSNLMELPFITDTNAADIKVIVHSDCY